ncbi:phosphoenolpyruvate hydrolase family protein [Azospirillum halopraeferens]|uniref:phosphoenolpyruvate hydrolase family protein n=1 Tax=Azospirillum halopraeferens TaxID=34010 RepID=UPI0004178861|nr:phosphoenolpyruvate hydrolase family protein [Azospirillum halopraeferens]
MDAQIIPILRTVAELGATAGDRLFCPALGGHPEDRAEYLALLPVQDSNGRLLDALAGMPDGHMDGVCAGVFAVDPFRPAGPFLATLRRAGVRAVANFPTTAVFDGETGETLRAVGLGPEREAAFLEQAARAGFAVTGFAADREVGRRLRAAGAARIVVHPGAATGDAARDAEAAAQAAAEVAALRRDGPGPVFVHLATGFAAHRAVLESEADGLVLLPA